MSYLLGHLVFLLGSWLDEFYDWARRYTLNRQIALLARRDRLLPWLARALIWLVFKGERNLAVNRAVRIKQQALDPFRPRTPSTPFNGNAPGSIRACANETYVRVLDEWMYLYTALWTVAERRPIATSRFTAPKLRHLTLLRAWHRIH